MFGRTTATALLLLACQLASGCYCCRPFFCCKHRFYGGFYGGGFCEPCTACYSAPPVVPAGPPVAPVPVYTGVPVPLPTGTMPPVTNPTTNPPLERIPSFSAAVPTGIRR